MIREQFDDGTVSVLNYAKIDEKVYGTLVSIEDEYPVTPEEFNVSQNYPNPFNGTTNVDVKLPINSSKESIKLIIYNILGSKVYEENYNITGSLTISINTDYLNLSSGTYFYSVSDGNKILTKKFLLLK